MKNRDLYYSFFYNTQPYELLKKFLKCLYVCREIVSGRTSYYPKSVVSFENLYAKYIGTKHALTFCNGTSSIEASLFAVGVKAGDDVIVPSCVFHSDIDAIQNMGANPIFIDTQTGSTLLDPMAIESIITKNTKAIVVPHLFGHMCDVELISQIVKKYGVAVIEDCSHSHGAIYNSRRAGGFGDIGCFSLQGGKAVAAGEGGVATTNSTILFLRMSAYSHFARHSSLYDTDLANYQKTGIGHKHRAHPLAICLARIDLMFLELYNKKINKNINKIKKIFDNCRVSFEKSNNKLQGGGYFGGLLLLFEDNDSLIYAEKLFLACKINVSRYPYEIHHKMKRYGSTNRWECPNTEYIIDKALFLDRRYFIFLPFFVKYRLKKISTALKIHNNIINVASK